MSSAIAIILALLLYALAIVPAIAIYLRPHRTGEIAMGLGFVVVGLGIWQTGIFETELTRVRSADLVRAEGPDGRCRQVVDLLLKAGAIRRSAEGEFKIEGTLWERLPSEAQVVATECMKNTPAPTEKDSEDRTG